MTGPCTHTDEIVLAVDANGNVLILLIEEADKIATETRDTHTVHVGAISKPYDIVEYGSKIVIENSADENFTQKIFYLFYVPKILNKRKVIQDSPPE